MHCTGISIAETHGTRSNRWFVMEINKRIFDLSTVFLCPECYLSSSVTPVCATCISRWLSKYARIIKPYSTTFPLYDSFALLFRLQRNFSTDRLVDRTRFALLTHTPQQSKCGWPLHLMPSSNGYDRIYMASFQSDVAIKILVSIRFKMFVILYT